MTVVLQLTHVSKAYEGTGTVLQGLDLTVRAGELITIVGRSGSGKSTLLNILGLLDRPTEGVYELAGQNMTAASNRARDTARAAHLGFVFQSYHLLPSRSVADNVDLGLLYGGHSSKERRRQALGLLRAVGLEDRASHKPTTLSGGERQRVAIARALMGSPAVLLCDEPTGNLDLHNAAVVLGLLRAAADSGVAVLVVTHDRDVARTGDRCLEVVGRKLAERTAA